MPGMGGSKKVPEKVEKKKCSGNGRDTGHWGTRTQLFSLVYVWLWEEHWERDAWMGGHDLVILRVKNWGADRQGGPRDYPQVWMEE